MKRSSFLSFAAVSTATTDVAGLQACVANDKQTSQEVRQETIAINKQYIIPVGIAERKQRIEKA
jgi:hypothetical protein